MWLHGAPGLHLPVPRYHLPHPRIPAVTQNKAIPFTTGVRLDGVRLLPPGIRRGGSTILCICYSQIWKSPFCSDPAALAVFCYPCCSLLPRARAHRDLLNVLFCLILRRIPCCKASCQYSLCWDCSFRPNTTLSSEGPCGACDLRTVVLTGPI